jgi:hypothetical protein
MGPTRAEMDGALCFRPLVKGSSGKDVLRAPFPGCVPLGHGSCSPSIAIPGKWQQETRVVEWGSYPVRAQSSGKPADVRIVLRLEKPVHADFREIPLGRQVPQTPHNVELNGIEFFRREANESYA